MFFHRARTLCDRLGTFRNCARYAGEGELHRGAERTLKSDLDQKRRLLGEEHSSTLFAMDAHATVLQKVGR